MTDRTGVNYGVNRTEHHTTFVDVLLLLSVIFVEIRSPQSKQLTLITKLPTEGMVS